MDTKLALGFLLLAGSLCLSACGVVAKPTVVSPTDVPAKVTDSPKPAATAAPQTAVPITIAPPAIHPTDTPTPIEVTFWHSYGSGSAEDTAMGEIVKAASASPDLAGIKINALRVSTDAYLNMYRTDVAAGHGPNMIIAPNDSLGDDARGQLIADITELAKDKLDGYSRLSLDGMSLGGRLYGIPEGVRTLALYYNKDLLQEAPKTTDDLLKAVASGARISLSLGCYNQWGFYAGFGAKILNEKAAFVDTTENRSNLTSAYQFLNEWWALGKKASLPKSDGEAAAPFIAGRIAATTNDNRALRAFRSALGDKLGVAPLPAGPKGPASPLVGVDGFFFNPNNKVDAARAALKVALFFTSAANQKTMAEKADHVPARAGVVYNNLLVKSFENTLTNGSVRPQSLSIGKYWGNFCADGDIWDRGVAPADFVRRAFEGAAK